MAFDPATAIPRRLDLPQGELGVAMVYCCHAPTGAKTPLQRAMAKKFPLNPKHPERICWGCDTYCAANDLKCGNGSGRTLHPAELIGEDWYLFGDWGLDLEAPVADPSETAKPPAQRG